MLYVAGPLRQKAPFKHCLQVPVSSLRSTPRDITIVSVVGIVTSSTATYPRHYHHQHHPLLGTRLRPHDFCKATLVQVLVIFKQRSVVNRLACNKAGRLLVVRRADREAAHVLNAGTCHMRSSNGDDDGTGHLVRRCPGPQILLPAFPASCWGTGPAALFAPPACAAIQWAGRTQV